MFYTSVKQIGNSVYERGYDDSGVPFHRKLDYRPTFYITSNKPSEWKTLDNKNVSPINPGSIKECREWLTQYKDVDNISIYGHETAIYQYLAEYYPDEIEDFNINKIRLYTLDIETAAELGGFPEPDIAQEEILLITIQDYSTKKIYTWGSRPFSEVMDNYVYQECANEVDLLNKFLTFWEANYPDVVSGWNCVPVNSNVWGKNIIHKMSNMKPGMELHDSVVNKVSPVNNKVGITQKLANGATITSSYDHIFPYILCPSESYTKVKSKTGNKSKSYQKDLTVKEAIENVNEKFVYVPLRKNDNEDNPNFTYEQCYLMGLIYTDGSMTDKKYINSGFTFYQSDIEFITELKEDYKIPTKIYGPYKNCFNINIPLKLINSEEVIYDQNKNKRINLELVSTFSEKQFYMFLSGLLDGDGRVHENTVGFCNYNNDLDTLYELCLWNGIFTCITKNNLHFIDIDFNKLNLRKRKRWNKCNFKITLNRDNSQKAKSTRFKKVDQGYYVRVVDFIEENCMAMMDIETDTHYFISSGVKVHNCNAFDIPYIINRIKRVLGTADAKRLSPWKFIRDRQVQKNNKVETQYEIYGVSLLDYMELYKKYSFKNPENYRLDTIAYNELGQNKLDHSQYETFKDFYTYGWDTYVKYNKIDVELVDRLEEKLQLINMAIDLAYQSKSNYEDVFYQVRMWDNIIFNYLNKKKIVIPLKKESNKSEKFAGAYVKEPIPGLYGWTVTLDLTSLYPHVMISMNIGPETLIDQPFPSISVDKIIKKQVDTSAHPDYSICPNGSMYSKERQGFIPAILEDMYEKRKLYKNLQIAAEKEYEKSKDQSLKYKISNYKVKQLSLKVCLNSGYGALGSPYFRFYELRNAEAITSSGQLALKWIENKLNIYFNKLLKTEKVDYCIYGDTDSVMLNIDPLVNKIFEGKDVSKEKIVDFINTIFSTKIQEYINESYTELADYLHAYKNKLHMKREKIADKFLITGKKHYIINVWDNEGVRYSEPKIAVTGIEAVKSSTPAFCRDKLNAAFKVLMNYTEEDMINFVEETKKEFFKLDPEEVAFPKGVSDVTKFSSTTSLYKKGTPIHVRGSILYNNSLKKHGLENKYNFITNGEKIKYCYLKMPNPIMENVIGFIQTLPKEFGLHAYVDYETQFDKTFVQPLKAILDIIGWKTEKTITLDQFFI